MFSSFWLLDGCTKIHWRKLCLARFILLLGQESEESATRSPEYDEI